MTNDSRETDPQHGSGDNADAPHSPGNMHADTQPWEDTCSCEPEPRWQALEEEQEAERAAKEEQQPAERE